jgi:hypothetical protein
LDKRFRVLILFLVLGGIGILLGSALAQWWQAVPEATVSSPGPLVPGRVRVQVLNGGGLSGVAWEATRLLRDMGFDVVSYGNAGTFSQDSSVVMDRGGQWENARLVAEVLGIEATVSEPDSDLYVDVSVVLGPEWTRPPVLQEPQEEIPWWDIRRFFRRPDTTTAMISRRRFSLALLAGASRWRF